MSEESKEKIPAARISGFGKVHIEGKGDVRISGSGFVSAEEIKISGSGSLPGGLKVKRLSCAGSVAIEGDIEAQEMSFSGSASASGNLNFKTLSVAGSLSVGGEVKGSLMKVAGSCKVGKIELEEELHVSGALTALGDLKVKNLAELHGGFNVEGKIVAREVYAEMGRQDCKVKNGIEADNVSIKPRKGIFGILRKEGGRLYTTEIIAKEKVYLENVYCQNVFGKDVTIGKGCVVEGKVRYSNSIVLDKKAKVANPPEKS